MTSVASRLKDALWSLRREFGMESDLDRLIKPIVFEMTLTDERLNYLFVDYPRRVPEDFKSALLDRIREIVRVYWSYASDRKGYHRVLKGIIFLENVARYRFEGCYLTNNPNTGYRLELKLRTTDK